MVRRGVAAFVTALAILAASVAWAGWLYLHTVADPSRSNRIAHAVLDNPAARHEVAVDISDSIATAANRNLAAQKIPVKVDGGEPSLQAAVEAALADPPIADNIVNAITTEHAEVLGATPAHPATINTALLLADVRAHLAPADPALARELPAVAPAQVRLPTVKVPYARQARRWAQHWDHVLALGALAGLAVGLLLGDRAAVARRWGVWGIGAGLAWAVLPPLAIWAGGTWATRQAAVVRAVVRGATGSVNAAAVFLAAAGAAAVLLSFVVPRFRWAPTSGAHARGRGATRGAGAAPWAGGAGAPRAGMQGQAYAQAAPMRSPMGGRPAADWWAPSPPRTQEVPVTYDRTGHLAARQPAGAGAPAVPGAAPGRATASGPGVPSGAPPSGPGVPAPPPPRPRRPGVSPPLLAHAPDDGARPS
ncbi:MAG TPA: hypothetical protein VMU14_17235 [Acidimicrobiales bacterium]|nr:hypothetical protein [Acidimicrobiales bacterium]